AMMNSPWAMLMTPIWPNVRLRPRAASRRMEPMLNPVASCPMRMSTSAPFSGSRPPPPPLPTDGPGAGWVGRGGRGWVIRADGRASVPGQVAGPVVGLEERIGLDRLAGAPHLVDQAVGADLADDRGLGDVVVLTVDGDGALGGVEADAVGGVLDGVDGEGVRLLDRVLPQVD